VGSCLTNRAAPHGSLRQPPRVTYTTIHWGTGRLIAVKAWGKAGGSHWLKASSGGRGGDQGHGLLGSLRGSRDAQRGARAATRSEFQGEGHAGSRARRSTELSFPLPETQSGRPHAEAEGGRGVEQGRDRVGAWLLEQARSFLLRLLLPWEAAQGTQGALRTFFAPFIHWPLQNLAAGIFGPYLADGDCEGRVLALRESGTRGGLKFRSASCRAGRAPPHSLGSGGKRSRPSTFLYMH